MAKITDPDFLTLNTEVVLDVNAKTIQLLVAGNLTDTAPGKTSGVSGKALYSFFKEEWKTNANLNRYRFPMNMIFEASFILINGWTFADQQSIDLIRDAGFKIESTGQEFANIISLGDIVDTANDQAYYQRVTGYDQSTIDFDKPGQLNEPIEIFDGSTGDYRDFLKVYLREYAKTYSQYNLLVDQDLSAITFQAYRLPLANENDAKITTADATVSTTAPYTSMGINYLKGIGFTTYADATVYAAESVVYDAATGRWFFTDLGGTSSGANVASDIGVTWVAYEGERQIGANWYAFNRIVEGNSATSAQIYEFVQYQLRQAANINADSTTLGDGAIDPNQLGYGTINGNVAQPLLSFFGDVLLTEGGVFVDNLSADFFNLVEFNDITVDGGGVDANGLPVTTTTRTNPIVAAGNLVFSENIVGDIDANTLYTMYFAYIRRYTSTNIAFTGAVTNDVTLDYSNDADLLDSITTSDYVRITGASNAANNGYYSVSAVDTVNDTLTITKLYGDNPVNETAGAEFNVDLNPFETPTATIVNDNDGNPITGTVTASTVAWSYPYELGTQAGRIANTDVPVIVIAQGLDAAKWIDVPYTIIGAGGQTINVAPQDELNYENQA